MNADALSFPLLIATFIVAAIVIWIAGIHLSYTTDKLANRFGFGEELAGMIILAIVTNLPEIAIVFSASIQHNMGIAIGNILGGVAIQTVVLVVLDIFGIGKSESLTFKASSIILILEGTLVLAVLSLVVVGHELPNSLIFLRVTPPALLIFVVWVIGIFLVSKARKTMPWVASFNNPQEQNEIINNAKNETGTKKNYSSTSKTLLIFMFCSVITLVAGVALEITGESLSTHLGIQGVVFGATFLAAATALPEISTGLASIKLKDYQMAVSDIFGGNAFLPVLFLFATLLSGEAVLPAAQKTDLYLTGIAMFMTIIYIWGLLFRPQYQILRMGVDSFIVLIIYIVGIAGLFIIS
ncbi:MAG: sodium:calcium antiporter [Bacteroidia bacterium]|nr:sodium:calcium antiporter [Bacteroidia bacterium]